MDFSAFLLLFHRFHNSRLQHDRVQTRQCFYCNLPIVCVLFAELLIAAGRPDDVFLCSLILQQDMKHCSHWKRLSLNQLFQNIRPFVHLILWYIILSIPSKSNTKQYKTMHKNGLNFNFSNRFPYQNIPFQKNLNLRMQ